MSKNIANKYCAINGRGFSQTPFSKKYTQTNKFESGGHNFGPSSNGPNISLRATEISSACELLGHSCARGGVQKGKIDPHTSLEFQSPEKKSAKRLDGTTIFFGSNAKFWYLKQKK